MSTITDPISERLLVGGEWTAAVEGSVFEVANPATGRIVGQAPDAGSADVEAAIDAASAALAAWRAIPARERARVAMGCATLIRERLDEIAEIMTLEQGKPLAEARGETEVSASFFEWFAGEAERVYGQVVPPQQPQQRIIVLRQPVGVVAAITPWNFPAAMMARKLAPALAAGCTAIVKPASATPLTAAAILRCLDDAGVPPGVVNLITSRDSRGVARQLFDDERVRKVSFTGSTDVGRELIRLSSTHVTRLSLELGGHSPYVVFADADLELAAQQMVISKFRNSGQTCVCANRAYVERSAYEELVELVAGEAERLVVGPGLDPETTMGPMIDAGAVEKVEAHVDDAVARGARIVTGGEPLTVAGSERGSFFAPTILADTDHEMLISTEETFGPALPLAPFDTEAEAVELANSTPYGLAAYLHTRDYARVLRVAEALEYGIVGVDSGIITAANAPFGGVKESGYGVEGGAYGIDEYLSTKYLLLGDVG
jgi:succinate-semialdehyde dehydrogenase / glutarate-semialdehyde dehydrogenase